MRHASRVVVGSPTARVATLAVTTLLLALLSVGALVAGAQSPSPTQPEPQALSFFSGFQAESAGGACQVAKPTVEVVGVVTQERGESWGCQTVTTGDPRFSGETRFIWNTDAVYGAISDRGAGGPAGDLEVSAVRQRIENEAGAWEGTLTELHMGSEFHQGAGWFVGEGAYEGLAAYVMSDADSLRIWGVIRPDDGFVAQPAFPNE